MQENSKISVPIDPNDSVDNEEIKPATERQDAFVVFANEKDLRHHEAIRIKASLYTGIALRVKLISPAAMENLLYAIDLDSGLVARQQQERNEKEAAAAAGQRGRKGAAEQVNSPKSSDKSKSQKNVAAEEEKKGLTNSNKANTQAQQSNSALSMINVKPGIVNLRFEECKFTRKAAAILSEWLKSKALIETICLLKVSFEDLIDFKKVTEGMKINQKLLKLSFQYMNFDEEVHGTSIGRVLSDSRTIRELDITHIVFDYRTFYDMCQAILNERCRLNILKLRGILIGEIEGKIIQFILMKNKQIHTLDLSECKTEDPANFDFFIEKMNSFCNVRYLTLEKMSPDLSNNIETLGESLADNTKLEVLILRDNRIKWNHYQAFWTSVMPNRTIQKLNLQRTEITDRVVEKLTKYLEQEDIALADLDVSKNSITDVGLKLIATSLMKNRSVMYLNLSQNKIKEDGMNEMVELLKVNKVLTEMSFGGNIISNEGIAMLAQFLPHNNTLAHLDLSRNAFNDSGFDIFAEQLAHNDGLTFLDIAKNKEVTDEGSLISFCEAMTINKKLKTIDLTGIAIRKPFLKQNFDQALKRNITLQEVIGKIPQNIINSELEQNILIEKEILPLYVPKFRAGKDHFNLALVEDNPENHSRLNLKEQPQRLIKAAFKLIRNYDIRSVDFTGSGIQDDSLRMLSLYLRSNPNLRSVVLDKNLFTDDGLLKLTNELTKNTKLAHLSIKGCTNVTNVGLQKLCDVISTTNTCLFQVDLDVDQFDKELATEVITESALNRDIQEKLKPVKITTVYDLQGNVLKVSSGSERQEVILNSDDESESDQEKIEVPQVVSSSLSQQPSRTSIQSQGNTETTEASMQVKTFKKPQEDSKLQQQQTQLLDQTKSSYKPTSDDSNTRTVVEVQFDGNAKIGDCFKSALKAWRIFSPNVIRAENQNLTDEHIEELCRFLENREMISKLNLRRNFISNQGAKSLGRFISEFDDTLTHLDITRNRIGQDGGKAILDALNATTRIVDCQCQYGNPISNKMGRIIEREIKANIQAVNYTNSNKENATKYEVIDKGPDFMRCAIKMAQLHNILHLSLPDNMLALEDARMIADLIKRNTPLRKLNLSMNQLDADCAALIANSLIYNSNLQLLDISKNMLGDLGVYLILTPLIRKHLQDQDIVSLVTPTIRDKELIQGKNVKSSKRLFNQIEIETQLQYLDLEQNMTTWESYKQIWLVLVANSELSVNIDDPKTMKDRDNSSIFSSVQYQKVPDSTIIAGTQAGNQGKAAQGSAGANQVAPISGKKVAPDVTVDDSKSQLLLDGGGSQANRSDQNLSPSKGQSDFSSENIMSQEPEDSEELDEEALIELERQAMIKEKERLKAEKERKAFERKRNRKICCQKFCCFKDEEQEFNLEDKMPSYTQICCWRFLKARRLSTQFYMGKETLTKLEQSKKTACIGLLISFNYLVLYAVVIVPFILISLQEEVVEVTIDGEIVSCEDDKQACDEVRDENRVNFNNFVLMTNAGVLVFFLSCELFVVCSSLKATNTSCNSYLLCQLITGLTSRAVILISAQLIAVFIQDLDVVNFVLGIVISSTLVLSQLRVIQIWFSSIRKDQNNLLPKVKQNFNICMSTNYLAAATLYKKVCVEASDAAIEQTDNLMAERSQLMSFSFADDEGKNKNANVKAKLAKSCKCCRWTSPKFYQLIMNDIPLIFCLPFAYIFGLMDTINAAVGVALTLLDLIFMLFYLGYDEELSIDSKRVFDMSRTRLNNKESINNRLFNDEVSVRLVDSNSDSSRNQDDYSNQDINDQLNENLNVENEILLTDNKQEGGPNSNSDTVNFDASGGSAHNKLNLSAQKPLQQNQQHEQQNDDLLGTMANNDQYVSLPPIQNSETQNDNSK